MNHTKKAAVAYLRIPDYPIWVWRKLEPELSLQELIVTSGPNVVAITPNLAQLGIEIGMALTRAQALAPQVPLRVLAEVEGRFLWEEVLDLLYQQTPRIESEACGVATCELTLTQAQLTAQRYQACIGWSNKRTLALLASSVALPGHVLQVQGGPSKLGRSDTLEQSQTLSGTYPAVSGEADFLKSLPVYHLLNLGIAFEDVQRLVWLGFQNFQDLTRITPAQYAQRFTQGKVIAQIVHPPSSLNSKPVRDYRPSPVVEVTKVLESPINQPISLPAEMLKQFYDEAQQQTLEIMGEGLRSSMSLLGFGYQWVGWIVENEQGRSFSQRRPLKQATSTAQKILAAWKIAWQVLWELDLAKLPNEQREIQRITALLGGVCSTPTQQGSLFVQRNPWSQIAQTFETRFPGKMLQLQALPGSGESYLPEDGFRWSQR
jgi:hypothetical protein